MARPFRFQPPALPVGMLPRRRLLERLARRWDRRLVTMTAGPGFGKSVLLATAVAGARAGTGRDVWLTCEAGDAAEAHLLAGLAEAFGMSRLADVHALADAVWAQAPDAVCFVLDDVHEIPAGSDGADLLHRLVTELPSNGHLVLASREALQIPTARLAVSGQLEHLTELDLTFDPDEVAAFAAARSVPASLLSSCGGWPAIAELAATARSDLVFEYMWEEVLARLGAGRAGGLARLAVAGGGDDRVAAALVPDVAGVAELVADVPLVQRNPAGWVTLHPLWGPALRRLLDDDEADTVRRAAAGAHCDAGRYGLAIELLAECEAWDEVLAVIRLGLVRSDGALEPVDAGEWLRMLPLDHLHRPEAQLAAATELMARIPVDALAMFEAAATGFRERGDLEAEVSVLLKEGVVRWWANDFGGLLAVQQRVLAIAASGSPVAATVAAIGDAAVAHLRGDSPGVFDALAAVDVHLVPQWMPTVHWLRSVAHRRDGDVARAELELDLIAPRATPDLQPQVDLARHRLDWLLGRVDDVRRGVPAVVDHYRTVENRYLETESSLELAAKLAWLGDLDGARALVDAVEPSMADTPGALAAILRLIARAALAVGAGDEAAAAELLRADPVVVPGRADNWYWTDRAAVALLHVLLPEHRAPWDGRDLAPVLAVGRDVAQALEAAREGDLTPVAELRWPDPGVLRAHLPARWVAELLAAGCAVGNPAPAGLPTALGTELRPALRAAVDAATSSPSVVAGARQLLAELPIIPDHRVRIGVLGPLEVRRDDVVVVAADLARRRVRELVCFLVAHRRVRREAAADALWPDLPDPRHNLRVTLNYLQRVLQPERHRDDPSFFLQIHGPWLELVDDDRLTVDAWELDRHLEAAQRHERAGDPGSALEAYRLALPLWYGEAFVDVADTPWGAVEQAQCVARYTSAAQRAGELALAHHAPDEARRSAEHALAADPTSEEAHALLARACLAMGDDAGARRALEAGQRALVELGVDPSPATTALITRLHRSAAPPPDR